MIGKYILFKLLILFISFNIFGNEIYTLKKGETLYRLSKKFNVPVDDLMKINHIDDPSQLSEGMKLKIPNLHTVQKGETLYSIARQYDVDLDRLIEKNNIKDSSALKVGVKLYIPYKNDNEETAREKAQGSDEKLKDDFKGLSWPHPGKRVNLKGKMNGIMIHGKEGDGIQSVSSGRVIIASPFRGFSRVIFIESEDRYIYVYAGNEKILVDVGDWVQKGEEIGKLGKDVHCGIPLLYFLVYHNEKPVDPYHAPRI